MEITMAGNEKGLFSTIGRSLHDVNVFLFEKNKKIMYLVALITIPGLTGFVFNLEANGKNMLGADDIRDIIATFGGGGSGNTWSFGDTEGYIQLTEKIAEAPYVRERSSSSTTISAGPEKVIQKISITVTWQDETSPPQPRVRRYQNQPDTFAGTLIWPDKNNTPLNQDSNNQLSLDLALTDQQVEDMFNQGDFLLTVTCTSAGDWQAIISPFDIFTLPDDGNDVSISIDVTYWGPEPQEE
ncbi:MAG: hypothetical protein ACMUHM_02145 [Thermoplasmatota archaeon]